MSIWAAHSLDVQVPDGPYTQGADRRAVAPSYTTSTIRGTLQTLSEQQLQNLSDGDRLRSPWIFCCASSAPHTLKETDGVPPCKATATSSDGNTVALLGTDTYEFRSQDPHPHSPFPHSEYMLLRIEEGVLL